MSQSTTATIDDVPVEAAAVTARQFVTFGVGGETFAVPLSHVREIIRYPEVVRAPLGPPSLEGLGNLRGTILPILSLRTILGSPAVEPDDSTRVVVLDHDNRPVGLVVDRMANVVTAEPDRIEPADAIRATVSSDLLTGVIKGDDGTSMVMILDARMLIGRQFSELSGTKKTKSRALDSENTAAQRERSTETGEIQLVSFAIGDQEYALPIETVAEIVQIPERVTEVPNCGAHVLGVMTLRDRLLPLVSLRRMLGMADLELSEANKIVVVSPAPGVSVGMVMDSVRQVLRVSRALIDPMPPMLAGPNGSNAVASICRLDGGRRLVSVLSAERLFDIDEMRALAQTPADLDTESGADAPEDTTVAMLDDEEQLVVFRVLDEEYAVPIAAVQEIVRVPDELIRIPRTPDFIEGVVNLRGAVLPVVDQRLRFGIPAAERNERQRIVVFSIGGLRTGFIVDSVSQVMRVPAALIGPAPELSAEQNRLIRRVVNLTEHKRMILMLEVDELLDLGEQGAVAEAVAA